MRGVRKAFGAVRALAGVDLAVCAGEVHGLIGENGAGKSTLMKVLSGAHRPDAGEIALGGRPYAPAGPAAARAAGVAMIYQELALAPHLSVEENIFLGRERSRFGFRRRRRDAVRGVLASLGHSELDPDAPVSSLGIGLRQVVEIARALTARPSVVIMDEPTSSLSAEDAEALFAVVRRLRERDLAVIYISHFLEEVTRICDVYTVLRDGRAVASGRVAETDTAALAEKMVGRTLDEMYPRTPHTPGAPALTVRALRGARLPAGVGFSVRRGEILGIAGLVGAGRSETVRAVFGLERAAGGELEGPGGRSVPAAAQTPRRALAMRLDLLSENRKTEGLAGGLSISANVTLSALRRHTRAGFIRPGRERRAAQRQCRALGIRCRDVSDPAVSLSGGNQQKVALARLLHHGADVLLLDEPTRGIDVGSKAEIYRLIRQLAAGGKAIVVVSSYLPELLGICDTLAVMHRGRMSAVRPVAAWSEQRVMLFAASGRDAADTRIRTGG
ncbi:MAG: sugar ABC transporter ATP-binding protein [Lentisphaerae bacterium]|nr:sugar ABC transporter ATP-binding protein [Lentisphaerota bacterium]